MFSKIKVEISIILRRKSISAMHYFRYYFLIISFNYQNRLGSYISFPFYRWNFSM